MKVPPFGINVTWGTRRPEPAAVPSMVMCGRFVQASSPELLVARFGVDEPAAARHEPSYNVAPRATVYAVRDRAGGDGGSADRRRYLSDLRWGLIPSWAKDPRVGDRMINARAESLADK